jgi:16S rRNA (cytosine1402-N4)-methyltransferase
MMVEQIITMADIKHYPVMHRESLDFLNIAQCRVIVDCTFGMGEHGRKFLTAMRPDALLIGIDRDEESLNIAADNLKEFNGRFVLVNGDFADLDNILARLDIRGVDAFFFDLGISSYQLANPQRGFSLFREGVLDMRMDKNNFLSAYDLVNNLSEEELANIFWKFGQERYARKIARFIGQARKQEAIATTTQLAQLVVKALKYNGRFQRIHPATRIFQALRIAVNRELEALEKGLTLAAGLLNPGGRVAVISFHSLEDRIVKHTFKNFSNQGSLKIITKKPVLPASDEVRENFPSRSAKLRAAEKAL